MFSLSHEQAIWETKEEIYKFDTAIDLMNQNKKVKFKSPKWIQKEYQVLELKVQEFRLLRFIHMQLRIGWYLSVFVITRIFKHLHGRKHLHEWLFCTKKHSSQILISQHQKREKFSTKNIFSGPLIEDGWTKTQSWFVAYWRANEGVWADKWILESRYGV